MAHASRRVARSVLDSGLVVLVDEPDSLPVVNLLLSLDAGARRDADGLLGLASIVGSLTADGAADVSPDDPAILLEAEGASLDVVTGYERTSISVTGLSARFDEIVELLAQLVRTPRATADDLEAAQRSQLTEIAEEESEPYLICRREFFREVYGEHPRGRQVAGSRESVERITRGDVLEFRRRHFVPGGAVLAVAGDVDAATAGRTIERAFAGWTGSVPPEPRPPLPPRLSESVTRRIPMAREQVHVSLGGLGLARSDPAYYAAAVLDVVLGDSAGFGSRLATRLREEAGLAYVVESDTCATAGIDPGVFWAYTATSPEHVESAIDGILDEMRRVRREPLTSGELESAIAYLHGRHELERETGESRVVRLVRAERYGLGLDYDDRYRSLIESVTADDVLAVARRVVDPDRSAIVVVGPESESETEAGRGPGSAPEPGSAPRPDVAPETGRP